MKRIRLILPLISVILIGLLGYTPAQEPATAPKGAAATAETASKDDQAEQEWIQLFNGSDLTGWTPKIRGHELGDNYADTFRVTDGLLTVSYDQYKPEDSLSMDGKKKPSWEKFGHLFYKDTFSNYILRAEYRFVGEQILNGPGWALRNNGLMIHGQDPATMTKMQKFPVSIEVQLVGGNGTDDRPNLCVFTPGTNIVVNGKLYKKHGYKIKAPTFHGDQWVTVEVEVRGNKVIRHKIAGETVVEYTQPQYDPKDREAQQFIVDDQLMISGGTISIQSESSPIQFRKIELMKLEPKK